METTQHDINPEIYRRRESLDSSSKVKYSLRRTRSDSYLIPSLFKNLQTQDSTTLSNANKVFSIRKLSIDLESDAFATKKEASFDDTDRTLYRISGQTYPWFKEKKTETSSKKNIKRKAYSLPSLNNISIFRKKSIDITKKNNIEKSIKILDDLILLMNPPVETDILTLFKQFIASILLENRAMQKLGLIIFLLNKNPYHFFSYINFQSPFNSWKWIKKEFCKHLREIDNELENKYEDHAKTELQNSDICYKNILAFEIAKTILTKNGYINIGILRIVRNYFLPKMQVICNYDQRLSYALQLIEKSVEIRKKIEILEVPSSKFSLVNHLIKIQVNKKYDEAITLYDVQLTVLTGLFSHLRQGPVGSCFSTHLAVTLLSSHLHQCLEDFHFIIKNSKLTRKIGNVEKDFPFLLKIGNQDPKMVFSVMATGELSISNQEKKSYLWEAPGIISACSAIGIDNPQKAIEAILKNNSLFLQNKNTITLPICKILSQLTEYHINSLALSPSKKMKLFFLAQFAYESRTRNGLLSVWENSIAEMAEGTNESMIKPAILSSISSVLLRYIRKVLYFIPDNTSIKKKIIDFFLISLKKRMHLHYDPNIYRYFAGKENATCYSDGGYIIYDKCNEKLEVNWKRIDSPLLFSQFISLVFEESEKKILKAIELSNLNIDKDIFLGDLRKFISSEEYIYNTMIEYYPQYRNIENLLENWEQYPYTPWRNLTGNYAGKVREVYMEENSSPSLIKINPFDPKKLLIQFIQLLKTLTEEQIKIFEANPFKKIPIITSTHAFTLMLGHPTLFPAIYSNLNPNDWIKKHFQKAIKLLKKSTTSPKFQQEVFEYAMITLVDDESKKNFLDEMQSNLGQPTSYVHFRNKLINALRSAENNQNKKKDLLLSIDEKIFSILPEEIEEILLKTAIHFADTNWNSQIHDTHLCFSINPCSNHLTILEIYDDGTKLRPFKQRWLLQEEWEVSFPIGSGLPVDDYHII